MPNAAGSELRRAVGILGADLRQRIQKSRHSNRLLKSAGGSSRLNVDLPASRRGILGIRESLQQCRSDFGRPSGQGTAVRSEQSHRVEPAERAYRHPPAEDKSAAIGAATAAALRRALSQ
jgi:hypothetical protein